MKMTGNNKLTVKLGHEVGCSVVEGFIEGSLIIVCGLTTLGGQHCIG